MFRLRHAFTLLLVLVVWAAALADVDLGIRLVNQPDYTGFTVLSTDGAGETQYGVVATGATVVYDIAVMNSGTDADNITITGKAGNSDWTVSYYDALTRGTDLTDQVTNGTLTITGLAASAQADIWAFVTPGSTVPGGIQAGGGANQFSMLITGTSENAPTNPDTVVATTVCSGNWPEVKQNPQGTGQSTVPGPKVASLKWKQSLGGKASSPVFGTWASNDFIYVDVGNTVIEYDAGTGAAVTTSWPYTLPLTGDLVTTAPAVVPLSYGSICVGTWNDSFIAVKQDGAGARATFTTSADVCTDPAVGADGTVYFGCSDGTIYGLDVNPATGTTATVVFQYSIGPAVPYSVVLGKDGTIYVGADDNNLYALAPYPAGPVPGPPPPPVDLPYGWANQVHARCRE